MRIRVKWPDGRQRQGSIETWRELYRFVGPDEDRGRRVAVEPDPDGDGFSVTVLPD